MSKNPPQSDDSMVQLSLIEANMAKVMEMIVQFKAKFGKPRVKMLSNETYQQMLVRNGLVQHTGTVTATERPKRNKRQAVKPLVAKYGDEIRRLYFDERLPSSQIRKRLGVTQAAIDAAKGTDPRAATTHNTCRTAAMAKIIHLYEGGGYSTGEILAQMHVQGYKISATSCERVIKEHKESKAA